MITIQDILENFDIDTVVNIETNITAFVFLIGCLHLSWTGVSPAFPIIKKIIEFIGI